MGLRTFRDAGVVWVNLGGPFFSPPSFALVPNRPYGVFLNRDTFKQVLVGHEVGHLTGTFGPDGDDPDLNRSYTTIVARGCIG